MLPGPIFPVFRKEIDTQKGRTPENHDKYKMLYNLGLLTKNAPKRSILYVLVHHY